MKEIHFFNTENVTEEEARNFRLRKAVRAVVLDKQNNVAVIHAQKPNFYELPGGGVDGDESLEDAIIRECLEEIGCNVEIISDLGTISEYRKKESLRKDSFCFLCKVIGEKDNPNFVDDEKDLDMQILWISLSDAITLIGGSESNNYISEFSSKRDILFLEEVLKKM